MGFLSWVVMLLSSESLGSSPESSQNITVVSKNRIRVELTLLRYSKLNSPDPGITRGPFMAIEG